MKLQLTKSGLFAIFFWVLSLLLAFKITPGTCLIWMPDTLLLLGFFPLLIGCRARWLWLGFGIGNMIIGWTLVLSSVIPDTNFATPYIVEIKKHLELYHPFMVWLLIGALSAAIGIILLTIKLIFWLRKKFSSNQ